MKYLLPFLVLVLILFIFGRWFLPVVVSGGDFVYYFPQTIKEVLPFASWDARHGGLGASVFPRMWIEGYFTLTVKAALLLPWYLYEKIFWFWPILIFLILSPYLLAREIFKDKNYAILSSLIYATNTYILLVVGGGQVGVAFAYALAPLAILYALRSHFFNEVSIKNSLIFGLLYSLTAMFDLRLAYVLAFGVLILLLCSFFRTHTHKLSTFIKSTPYTLLIPFMTVLFFHMFWVLPIILSKSNPIALVGSDYTSLSSVVFFSFAKLENTISLLHPNWPDNVFGKVTFLPFYFLFIPFIAFSSLLYLRSKTDKLNSISPIVLIGLLGIFLGKGVNPPFGSLYIFMFEHLPGFQMFRDPTKWYLLIALSYSILIPFTLKNLEEITLKGKKKLKIIITFAFILFWCFTIREILFSTLSTFKPHHIDPEYEKFASVLTRDNRFYRTLWLPSVERYGFSSQTHPAIGFADVASKGQNIDDFLSDKKNEELLEKLSVRYIIIPIDSEKEIFLTDRKYDENVRLSYRKALDQESYLKRDLSFSNLLVYSLSKNLSHFYTSDYQDVDVVNSSPVKYTIVLPVRSIGKKLIFSELFDPNWELIVNGSKVSSQKDGKLNSFTIQSSGTAIIEYTPQKYVWYGLIVSIFTVVISIIFIFKKK